MNGRTMRPGLQPGRAYQLWLMRGKSPGIVSAGVFGGDRMSIELTDASLLQDIRGLAVTEEPKGGSPPSDLGRAKQFVCLPLTSG